MNHLVLHTIACDLDRTFCKSHYTLCGRELAHTNNAGTNFYLMQDGNNVVYSSNVDCEVCRFVAFGDHKAAQRKTTRTIEHYYGPKKS